MSISQPDEKLYPGMTVNLWLTGLTASFDGDDLDLEEATVEFDILDMAGEVVAEPATAELEENGSWRLIVTLPDTPGSYTVRVDVSVEGANFKARQRIKVERY